LAVALLSLQAVELLPFREYLATHGPYYPPLLLSRKLFLQLSRLGSLPTTCRLAFSFSKVKQTDRVIHQLEAKIFTFLPPYQIVQSESYISTPKADPS